ncbi:UDP-glucose/GDP-mannose dehydrogenase family protein [Neobacillus sp. DY30]|uniref:UDP-glucose dehydrogenase family protein n=1 Tax=Neobacillus sp. DY30 TaxID=3047871 RepID=UPI0024BFC976|nr:UDP-glucose/GDP-mannose dehydrogenase family protein [Neobacillus sp. DY30]WHY00921.1 UDP-glucose/GDP-mannose dehydrogenase family protein [Neobacillus sp. DY30]
MKITLVGTGHVGLITGTCLAEIGHMVTCYDVDRDKIQLLKRGCLPFFEPGLNEMVKKNTENGRLSFTYSIRDALLNSEIIYITVGTPMGTDGQIDLNYIYTASDQIAEHITNKVIIVMKSTVPIGTNRIIKERIQAVSSGRASIEIVSNPEFLREGTAIHDTLFAERIIIGSDSKYAAEVVEKINQPFDIPIFKTDLQSAELIKYSSNAFLATKISFINEIAQICERVGANIEDVAYGMGLDSRIGSKFLRAGIGYGGSCFPKDVSALIQTATMHNVDMNIIKAANVVNQHQQVVLIKKAKQRFGSLHNKKAAILGLSFKPNTDDIRDSPAVRVMNILLDEGVQMTAYDPVAIENVRKLFGDDIYYSSSIEGALVNAEMAFIFTEWEEIKKVPLSKYKELMSSPVLFDGRNCYSLEEVSQYPIEYYSIGR